eukprot:GEMP01052402.1.p1 GENE.GEMP01052402.1~~GEMP01052402.1.p1  ORF type:complete len:250 (+),score=41.15 GEMP01052402.1:51-752(+)
MTEECITCHEPRLMYEFHDPCRSCRAISTSCLMCPVEPCYCLPNMTLLSRNDKRKAEGDLKLNALLCSAFNDKPAVASNGTICALRVNGEKVEVSVHESDALEDVKNEIAEAFKFKYLNGSALLYSGSTRMKTVDFFDGNHGDGHSITHSGKAYSWDLSQKLETPRVLLQEPNRTSCAVRRGLHARLISHAWRHLSMQSTLRSAATAPCAAMIHTFAIFMIPPSRSLPTRQKS